MNLRQLADSPMEESMQTANQRYWLRMLTRKPLRRISLGKRPRQWWSVHGKTVKARLAMMLLAWGFIAVWVGALMMVEWAKQ